MKIPSVHSCIREAVSFRCPTARLPCLQLIYPENGTPRLRDQLLNHSNLTVEHYDVSLDELAIRLSAKVANRQPGLQGAKASFGSQYHSKIILEDAALHKRIEVCPGCMQPLFRFDKLFPYQPCLLASCIVTCCHTGAQCRTLGQT